jgi:molybdopterin converting factor small subunit
VAVVNFYAAAKAASGSATLKIPAGSLGALIEGLANRSPELAKLLPTCSYLLNGESCEDLGQILVEGDAVDVLPQFAGG